MERGCFFFILANSGRASALHPERLRLNPWHLFSLHERTLPVSVDNTDGSMSLYKAASYLPFPKRSQGRLERCGHIILKSTEVKLFKTNQIMFIKESGKS